MSLLREGEPLPPAEDFVIAQTADSEEAELVVAPPDGKTPDEVTAELGGLPDRLLPAPEETPRRSALSFSLFELFAAMTFVSIALAGASWLPLQPFVGLVGLCTILALLVSSLLPRPHSRLVKLAWGTLVATYILAAAVALVRVFL